ncbi:transcriptional regulator family: Zinc finger, GRF-type [Aspergillus niger]|nr:transcriptional regulator family: Zinc finger, GRF-type [Aspergillus niger]KAI2901348.1 transcriptional regulator family: Zinc finger, GRF-type [Aspergillus niger]KAI3053683.1 transcriptional regulator family: Zinc finger, GRF-type [Aspergillus niger]KAI3079370.1 transcriptional regulator family: Zinc finger, GRF-type [Aspergillus niger]
MLSPTKAFGSSPAPHSPRTAVPLRGLFLDGVWRCNCPERPPAVKFQTKNHGVNHGRWFYVCQKPQEKRCRFFLWASDAEVREKHAVLINSRTEPAADSFSSTTSSATIATPAPETPTKKPRLFETGLLTPQTDRTVRFGDTGLGNSGARGKGGQLSAAMPPQSAKARMMAEDLDEFEWDISDDTAVGNLLGSQEQRQQQAASATATAPMRQPDFGPPKTPSRDAVGASAPEKRKLDDISDVGAQDGSKTEAFTPTSLARSFTDRAVSFSSTVPSSSLEFSKTPTPVRFVGASPATGGEKPSSDLAAQAVEILDKNRVVMPEKAKGELMDLLQKYELKVKGIARGRDISRIALKKKDDQIKALNERISMLERR